MLAAALRTAARLKSGSHAAVSFRATPSRYFGSAQDAIENTISYGGNKTAAEASSSAAAAAAGVVSGRGRDTLSAAVDALDDIDATGGLDFNLSLDAAAGLSFRSAGDGDGGGGGGGSKSNKKKSSSAGGGAAGFGDVVSKTHAAATHRHQSSEEGEHGGAGGGGGGVGSEEFDDDVASLDSALDSVANLSFGGGGGGGASSSSAVDLGSSLDAASLDAAFDVAFPDGAALSSAAAATAAERRAQSSASASASSDGASSSSSHNQPQPFRESYAHRRKRGKTKLLIVGEDEAREKRKQAMAAMDDPGMDGIRIALLAMAARKRQLYNPYSYVERSESDPRMRQLENRQRDNEVLAVDAEVERYKEELEKTAQRGDGSSLPLGRRLLQGFYEPLTKAIDAEQECIRLGLPGVDRKNYGSFFLMLNADKLAVITLHIVISELMKGTEAFNPDQPQAGMVKFVRVVERLGEAVQAEVNLARMRKRARVQKDIDQERMDEVSGVRDLAEDVVDVEAWSSTHPIKPG